MKHNKSKQVRSISPGTIQNSPKTFPSLGHVAGLFLLAFVVRAAWLGEAAFRADTLHFYQWAIQGLSFSQVFGQWMQMMGDTAQFPLPAAIAVGLADWLPLAPSAFTIRLADALFGSVAVLFGALAAREIGGKGLMWFAGGLWILSPFHVQLSREAYFYSALVTGASMLTWNILYYAKHMRKPIRLPGSFYVILGCGFVLSAYSHFTGWIIASVAGLALIVMSYVRRKSKMGDRKERNLLLMIPVAAAFPLLFFPWAIPYFLKDIGNPNAKAESIRVMGEVTEPMLSILSRYGLTMGWGSWLPGMVLTSLAVLGFLVYTVKKRRRVLCVALGVMLACLAGYLLIMKARGLYVAVRHSAFIFPLYITLISCGLWYLWTSLLGLTVPGCRSLIKPLRRVTILIALVLSALPAWHVVHLTGYPTPYREIKTWFDRSLPFGTPVLVDRWFEPWNELTIYPTTNVVFTFTGPNEPLDVYLSTNWREQAVDFFARNPDAAYFEIAKSYWEKPEVGPWEWPRTNFVRHAVIKNESGLVLRDMGLAYREDFYSANSNRVVVEIFYNTRDDVLARRRAEGKNFQVFFGAGLPYEKSGPMGIFRFQTQQFMDWRVLGRAGKLDVYNLTDAPAEASLRIDAISPRGPKLVSAGEDKRFQFSGSQMQRWMLGPLTLQPGLTTISLEDPLFDRSGNPLLVAGVEVF